MQKLKILMIGPCKSGKTYIANFLSDSSGNYNVDYYRPTKGVRILEFESPNLNIHNRFIKSEIELWDCSGDHKFESCWPTVQKDINGLIFVYNPFINDHSKELELLYNYFVTQTKIHPDNCLVFAHIKQPDSNEPKNFVKLSNSFTKIQQVNVNIEESGNILQEDFNNFIKIILSHMRDSTENEELNIIRSLN